MANLVYASFSLATTITFFGEAAFHYRCLSCVPWQKVTMHVALALEGSHYKPVKSPFVLVHYWNYCTRGVVSTLM